MWFAPLVQVYLQDSSDFIDCYMKAWTLKRPEMQPFDMRPYVAHQIARLNWISDASQSALGDRFLLGLRDRNTPTIEVCAGWRRSHSLQPMPHCHGTRTLLFRHPTSQNKRDTA